MLHHQVRFENEEGYELAGVLDMPDKSPRAWALFAHCFTGSKNLKATRHISRALNDSGIAVLRFDFTGLGESEGEFADTTFSSNVTDLVAAAEFLEREHRAPRLLVGHSLGGTAVLRAAAEIPSAVAIATIGAPSHPSHVIERFEDAVAEIRTLGEAAVELAGRTFTLRRSFLSDLERHPLPESLGGLRTALLFMHSPLDEIVELDNASELFLEAKHPKSFVTLDDADHLLTREEDARYAGRVLSAWAEKYLFGVDEPAEGLSASAGEAIARTRSTSLTTELNAAGHRLITDEPESYGGDNLGPTPYDLLSAGLAGCTTMTLQMYARHKGLALDTATARVRHDKTHAKDCADCESEEGKIDEFQRSIVLTGDLTEDERQRLLDIADRCPVHKTLHGVIRIRTRLV
ncbi:MAG TPA: bifunctional alpha/beta hydrolase/OsmC family protein [Woeseiaceae bacterium]|nr:bifunctional alpha/beta hydrolase/OsmC family protein [Woeseiaceae bacterium]